MKNETRVMTLEGAGATLDGPVDLRSLVDGIARVKVGGKVYHIDCTGIFGPRSSTYWPDPVRSPERAKAADILRREDERRLNAKLETLRITVTVA